MNTYKTKGGIMIKRIVRSYFARRLMKKIVRMKHKLRTDKEFSDDLYWEIAELNEKLSFSPMPPADLSRSRGKTRWTPISPTAM